MGIGSYLVLLNATPWPWSLTYQHSYQMNHWEDTLPDIVNPGEDFQIYVEQSNNVLDDSGDDGAEATYTFQNWEGDTAPTFQVQYREGDDGPEILVDSQTLSTLHNAAGSTLQLQWAQNENSPFIVASSPDTSTTELVSSNPPEDWMHQTYDRISCLMLKQLCMPGTHDSGMSEWNAHTIDAEAYDTVTQYMGIGDQLLNGARWFDLRPVISGGGFVTGHYSYINVLGWQGGNGQSMQEVIDQVNSFTDSHQELMILEFTHGLDSDILGSDSNGYHLTQDNWNDLLNDLLEVNNRVLNMADVSDISSLQVSSFIESSAAVILVVDDQVDEDGTPVDLGDYANQGFFTRSQWNLYNSYADESDYGTIESNQIDKMNSIRTSSESQPFLLSWTATWSGSTLFTSITDLADGLNNLLWTDLWAHLSSSTYPNVIMVDAFTSTSSPFPALAMAVNYYFAPTCTAASSSTSSAAPFSAGPSSAAPSSAAASSTSRSGSSVYAAPSSSSVADRSSSYAVVSSSASAGHSSYAAPSSSGAGYASSSAPYELSSYVATSSYAASSSAVPSSVEPVSSSSATSSIGLSDQIMRIFND